MYISRTNLCFVPILAWQWGSAFGGLCQSEPESCDYTETTPQENWFFTQYISYLNASEVFVNVSSYFESCRLAQNPRCNRLYVDMYLYERNGTDRAAVRNTINYRQLMLIEPNGLGQAVNQITIPFIPSGNFNGFYIGVRANGTCASIRRLQVYYRVSPARTDDLVIYPEIALPALGSNAPVTGVASCAPNSRNLTSLQVTCSADGRCQDVATCTCDQGYEYVPSMSSQCMHCDDIDGTAEFTHLCAEVSELSCGCHEVMMRSCEVMMVYVCWEVECVCVHMTSS